MTFIFHPLSHCNSITEPRAQFLLSLLEDISINFPSINNIVCDYLNACVAFFVYF